MKSKQYLKNLIKAALISVTTANLLLGCSSSTEPSYKKKDIETAIKNILKKEYDINLRVKLEDQTLWLYMPVENIIEHAKKPEKYFEKFAIDHNNYEFQDGFLKLNYVITAIPTQEKTQELSYNKQITEKISYVWNVIRRVLFSLDRKESESEPNFISFVAADIKTGIELRQLSYYTDLKKVSYGLISPEEYQHRTIHDYNFIPEIIGDSEGSYLKYTDFTLDEFIAKQIQHRIKLKFQVPEVEQNVDIDKEITKIVTLTLKIYGLGKLKAAELNNLFTKQKFVLTQTAILPKTIKQ